MWFWCRQPEMSCDQTKPLPNLSKSPPSVIRTSPLRSSYLRASALGTSISVNSIKIEEAILDIGHAKIRPPLQLLFIVGFAEGNASLKPSHILQPHQLPMRRHIAQPLDAARLHGCVGIEPLGDGVAYQPLTLLLQEFDQPLLLGDQGVDLREIPIKPFHDSQLFGDGW